MRYLIRSLKYFLYLTVVLSVIMAVLICIGAVEKDPELLFRNGYDSIWQIALMILAFAAVYPNFGYTRRAVHIHGDDSEIRPIVDRYMKSKGYRLEKEDGADMTWRKVSLAARISRTWEDRITFTREISGFTLEGRTKDITVLAAGLQFSADNNQ